MTEFVIEQPILATGATGFIGSHLVSYLVKWNSQVRAFVLPDDPTQETWRDQIEICHGDISDYVSVERAMAGVKTVFHLAALVQDWGKESDHQRVTVGGTENVFRAASRERARVVLVSSVVVYGDQINKRVCSEEVNLGKPMGLYSQSKQAQERIARDYIESEGTRATIVRPTNVYGSGSKSWVDEVVDLLQKGMITLVGDGDQNAGLCYIDNLVDVLVRAASFPNAVGRVYNAADGSDVTWRRYFTDLARIAVTSPPRSAPLFLARPLAYACESLWRIGSFNRRPPMTLEALNLVGSHHRIPIQRAKEELEYEPLVSYEESLQPIEDYVRGRTWYRKDLQ
jgi:nucleoside-diphosphate-sugar epimerase